MKFDVIGAVEACYAGMADDQAWLSGLLDAVSPLARDSGVQAQVFRGQAFSLSVESRLVRGIPPDVLGECDRIFQGAPLDFWSPVPPVEYATTRARRIGNEFLRVADGDEQQTFRRYGMEDHFGIFAADLDGRRVVIAINIPAGAPLLPSRIVHRLRSLAAHLTSGVRLRSALGVTRRHGGGALASPSPAAPEAVLDPAGRALDATGPAQDPAARESLGEAVRLMEKARGPLRRSDADEALQLWQGLVDGTWSLVEHHDTDGKRYLLARRNQPGVREPTALTRNERSVLAFAAVGHQNKYIAYLLGLSPSTVASHLRSAERKLGLSSRGELIRTFAPVVLAAPELASVSSAHDRPHA